jgi:hypothetical protein
LVFAVVALAIFRWAGGSLRDVASWGRRLVTIDHRALAGVLAASVLVVGVSYSPTAVGGADAYGYVSEADLWMHGWPEIDQPWIRAVPWPRGDWTFSPLGYRPRDLDGRGTVLVPVYAPGLSLLMAAGKWIGGQEGVFWIVPIGGALLVLATYGLGRRLSSSAAGLAGAWLVATSPVVIFMLMTSMNDVPVAAAWAWAFYFLLGEGAASATAAGLAAGLAILIRPNLVPLAAIMGLWYLVRLWRDGAGARVRAIGRGALFSAGVAAGAGAIAVINQHLYGSRSSCLCDRSGQPRATAPRSSSSACSSSRSGSRICSISSSISGGICDSCWRVGRSCSSASAPPLRGRTAPPLRPRAWSSSPGSLFSA